ncbi:RelA/SpoT domain-containing protein, partial [Comamonas aquatica]
MENTKKIWKDNLETIRKFLEVHPDYQQLCTEIEYILKKRVKENNIEFSSLTSRAKTLNSFIEKIDRKNYKEPFQEITDFAGVRVVCLYSSDIEMVSKLIREEFIVQEEINKKDILNADQFGYGAKHFIVKLG